MLYYVCDTKFYFKWGDMKETVIHVRINEETKIASEVLFAAMGTSTSEAIRLFLKQCMLEQRIPFLIKSFDHKRGNGAYGFLSLYANSASREQEREAWIKSLEKK